MFLKWCLSLDVTILIFYSLNQFVFGVAKTRCSTPNDWLDSAVTAKFPLQDETNIEGKYVHRQIKATKWPGGIIKFKLHSSLDEADRKQVMLAIDEFHRKTCLKFEEWTEGESNFVSIERDDSLCGVAKVCMQLGTEDGYQFAKFGGPCRNKATMVHELGHTICLGHEHERPDRDEYLSFEDCPASEVPRKSSRSVRYGIYDFDSQMHYSCGCCGGGYPKHPYNGFGCGEQVSSGLSLMDAETINQLYKCQDCRRHRWIPMENLNETDIENLPNFGVNGVDEKPLRPCRAAINGQVLVGMFMVQNRVCLVLSNSFEMYVAQKNIEVLRIVGGLRAQNGGNEYRLVKHGDLTTKLLSEIGIRAGKFLEVTGPSGDKFARFGFIEFATVSKSLFMKQDISDSIIDKLESIAILKPKIAQIEIKLRNLQVSDLIYKQRRKFFITQNREEMEDEKKRKTEQLEQEIDGHRKKVEEYKAEININLKTKFDSIENECIQTKIDKKMDHAIYSNWLKNQSKTTENDLSVSTCFNHFKNKNDLKIKEFESDEMQQKLEDWRKEIEFQCKIKREFEENLMNKTIYSDSDNFSNLVITTFERNPCWKDELYGSHRPSIYNYFENGGCQNRILVCS